MKEVFVEEKIKSSLRKLTTTENRKKFNFRKGGLLKSKR
jgi:hypothetical protein